MHLTNEAFIHLYQNTTIVPLSGTMPYAYHNALKHNIITLSK